MLSQFPLQPAWSPVHTPVDTNLAQRAIHILYHGSHERQQTLLTCLIPYAQNLMCATTHQIDHSAQPGTFRIHHIQAKQIDPVILTLCRSRQSRTRRGDETAFDRLGSSPIIHPGKFGDIPLAMRLERRQFMSLPVRLASISRGAKPPLRHRAKCLGIVTEKMYPNPTAQAVRFIHPAKDHHVRRGIFTFGQHGRRQPGHSFDLRQQQRFS
ncbi:protein of unknown function [Sterolibacterium denitrificans]|uniref:Uncharacterized protein n=1 Tax=Sterolibacterium denitrificans TaxID=157592 RepID=A0A7Z7HR03_9PROT|nr:protein of unknown function [Sterolibacterium denitrificans]